MTVDYGAPCKERSRERARGEVRLETGYFRDGMSATKTNYVEILNFRHFFKHIVFTSEGDKIRNKEIKNYINV